MDSPVSNTHTLLAVGIFALVYLMVILRQTARHQLDIYDFFMLSMVALLPVLFAFAPSFANWASKLTGVAFPFVVMFGLLLAVIFIFIYRLTIKVHKLETQNRLLIQEVSLVYMKIKPDLPKEEV